MPVQNDNLPLVKIARRERDTESQAVGLVLFGHGRKLLRIGDVANFGDTDVLAWQGRRFTSAENKRSLAVTLSPARVLASTP